MTLPTLDPTMTRAELLLARRRVTDYEFPPSVDKARLYILATKWLLESPVSRIISASQGEETDIDTKVMQAELEKAETWLRENQAVLSGGNSNQRFSDFRNFRQ